jgi:hypothetical protein
MIVTCPKGHQFYYSEEDINKRFQGLKAPQELGIPLGEQTLGEAHYDHKEEDSRTNRNGRTST